MAERDRDARVGHRPGPRRGRDLHAQRLRQGFVVTRGAAGSTAFLAGGERIDIPALAIDALDTTGAGDTFAGGLVGYIASQGKSVVSFEDLRRGVVYGSVLASYNVEAFSLERMRTLTKEEIRARYDLFRAMTAVDEIA